MWLRTPNYAGGIAHGAMHLQPQGLMHDLGRKAAAIISAIHVQQRRELAASEMLNILRHEPTVGTGQTAEKMQNWVTTFKFSWLTETWPKAKMQSDPQQTEPRSLQADARRLGFR